MNSRSAVKCNRILAHALRASLAAWPVLAQAQGSGQAAPAPGSASATDDIPAVVVVGVRPSLSSAQQIKRNKMEIVDSIVASDIDKLPDYTVTDALQRVTGVQVARDRGDGANVAIRGLTQMETTLNGREIFTAGMGRNLEFADIPSEMVAGIDVYKTSSAQHLEGGVGGLIDLRTRRPFDFKGPQFAASVRGIHGDLVGKTKEQFSFLGSNRWKTNGAGEFGVLVDLSHQERAYREDLKSTGRPVLRTINGQSVEVSSSTNETTSMGARKRNGADVTFQWRPAAGWDLYAEGHYAELLTIQDSYQIGINAPATGAGNVSLLPGTNAVQSVTWTNASAYTAGAARDMTDRTTQFAAGGSWTGRDLTLKTDLSYTKSHNYLHYGAIVLNGTAPTFTQDISGSMPATSAGGTSLSTFPGGFTSAAIWNTTRPFDGDLKAARIDGEYRILGDFLESVDAGLRFAKRHASDAPGQIGIAPSTPIVANAGNVVAPNPIGNFMPGSTSLGGYYVGDPNQARDVGTLCNAMSIACVIPSSNPLGTWNIDEETQSGYAMAKIDAFGGRAIGNAGVRVVSTRETVSGYQNNPGTGVIAPIGIDSRYTDVLPSINTRIALIDDLYLRGALSKTLTRPDFLQMSPSLTLNAVQRAGTAGNPGLRPIRADNFDLALERYFSKTTSVSLTAFAKKVDGFVLTQSAPETYDGITYQVSRPRNAKMADVVGYEVGYQQFYDFLPGWMRGLGLQANYTFVASDTYDSTLKRNVPLQNLSRHSFNIVGMYEQGQLSARLAYNWRDKFLTSVAVTDLGPLPVYTKAYGWLDASITWRFDDKTSIALVGSNLLKTVRSSYYDIERRPESRWVNDRQIAATLTLRF